MIEFIPEEYTAEREVTEIIKQFIKYSKTLNQKQKDDLIKEYDDKNLRGGIFYNKWKNWFVRECQEYAINAWIRENHYLEDLWKKVAIENAKINNTPYDIANETLEVFKEQFKLLEREDL